MIFAFLETNLKTTNKPTYTNEQLYAAFPTISKDSIRNYAIQWYKAKTAKPITNITNIPDISQNISQPLPAAIPKPTKLDTDHITEPIVEKWIIMGDPRAKLGMDYLQYRDRFSQKEIVVEDYRNEFKELLESEC